jgi:hypothetical protein
MDREWFAWEWEVSGIHRHWLYDLFQEAHNLLVLKGAGFMGSLFKMGKDYMV